MISENWLKSSVFHHEHCYHVLTPPFRWKHNVEDNITIADYLQQQIQSVRPLSDTNPCKKKEGGEEKEKKQHTH